MSIEASLFLASNLGELNHIENKHEAATVAMATIAAVHPEINETHFLMFLSQVTLEDQVKKAAVSYFCGAEMIKIYCDCTDEYCGINEYFSEFWIARGERDKEARAPQYSSTMNWIASLRNKLY